MRHDPPRGNGAGRDCGSLSAALTQSLVDAVYPARQQYGQPERFSTARSR